MIESGLYQFVKKLEILYNNTPYARKVVNSAEELVKVMDSRGMIYLHDIDVSRYDCDLILNEILMYMNKSYTEDEVCAYFLKYYFGMKNADIRAQAITIANTVCHLRNLDIRRIEKMYMTIRRRVFNQPKYTNPDFKYLRDLVCSINIKSAMNRIHVRNMTIDEFMIHCLDSYLSGKYKLDMSHAIEFGNVKKAVSSAKLDINFNFSEFPWCFLRGINDEFFDIHSSLLKYMAEYNVSYQDILNNADDFTKLIQFNMRAILQDDRLFDILIERFMHRKTFSEMHIHANVSKKHGNTKAYVSGSRLEQLYNKAMHKISSRLRLERYSLFSGLHIIVRNPDKLERDLVRLGLDAFEDRTLAVISAMMPADFLCFEELLFRIHKSPLIMYIIKNGFESGLVKADTELMANRGDDLDIKQLPESIHEMGLSYRTANALMRHGYYEPKDVAELSYNDIRDLPGIGPKSANEIMCTFAAYGYHIKEEVNT